jgi:tRNA dimethylallyltransferase
MKSVREQPSSNRLIAIVGPTASGKSALAMELAQKYGGEIICADSRTIYKGFDIGTAKPTGEDQALVPHHLLDICEPGEVFSAAQFKVLAEATIRDIWRRGKAPFLVGGSGMYVDSVLFGYQFRESGGELKDYSAATLEELQLLVADQYPTEFETIDGQNRLRLEQILARGIADAADRGSLKYDALVLGLSPDRLLLKQRIARRIELMLSNGFVQEVEGLIKRYGSDCPQLGIIGYKHAQDYLEGNVSLTELKERFAREDGALAKRQVTWFKRNEAIHWLTSADEADELVRGYLSPS